MNRASSSSFVPVVIRDFGSIDALTPSPPEGVSRDRSVVTGARAVVTRARGGPLNNDRGKSRDVRTVGTVDDSTGRESCPRARSRVESWARARDRLDLFRRREDLQRWCVDERARARASGWETGTIVSCAWSSSARRGRRRRRRRAGERCGVSRTRGIGDGETLNDGRDGGKTRAWRRDGRRRRRGDEARMKMNARVIRNVRARGLTDGVLVACAAFHRSGIRAQEA